MSAKKVILTTLPLLSSFPRIISAEEIAICRGEGPRYGDFKCNHDFTHRVCMKLTDTSENTCKKRIFYEGLDFWDITGQKAFEWSDKVCYGENPGEGWCICMWATAKMIQTVGCDNVEIDCAATSVTHVMSNYIDGGYDLKEAQECLEKKCPTKSVAAKETKDVQKEILEDAMDTGDGCVANEAVLGKKSKLQLTSCAT